MTHRSHHLPGGNYDVIVAGGAATVMQSELMELFTVMGLTTRISFGEGLQHQLAAVLHDDPDLYREHISSALTAIQLDQKVAAAALRAGEFPEAAIALLHQGPYSQFQIGLKQVNPAAIEQYSKGTVAQVIEIQRMRS